MKKIFLLTAISFTIFFINNLNAQNIDSISIHLSKIKYSETGPWNFTEMQIDSFSTNLLISSLIKSWNGNSWDNALFYNATYSASIKSSAFLQTWNNMQWDNNRKWIYTYSSTVDSVLSQKWNSAWENDSMTTTSYNVIGFDSLKLYQKWKSSFWQNASKIETDYTPDSSLLTQSYAKWDTVQAQWNYTYRQLYLYDSIGAHVATVDQSYGLGSWHNETIRYPGGGKYGWDDADSSWSVFQGSGSESYDSLGRITHFYFDGFPGGYSEKFYYYDSNGVLIYTFSHSESQGGFIDEFINQWFYFTYPDSSIFSFASEDTLTVCKYDSISIGFFAFGGTSPLHFKWTPSSAVSNDTIENPIMIADTATTLIVTASDDDGNIGADTIFANVNSPYISSIQSIPSCIGCNNGMFVLTISGGTGYSWYYLDTVILSANYGDDTLSGLPPGIYNIITRDQKGCSTTLTDTIFETNVFVNEISNDPIKYFPNPFTSRMEVILPVTTENIYMKWFDQSGRCVRIDKLISGNNTLLKNNLLSGSYVGVLMSDEKLIGRIKIIILD